MNEAWQHRVDTVEERVSVARARVPATFRYGSDRDRNAFRYLLGGVALLLALAATTAWAAAGDVTPAIPAALAAAVVCALGLAGRARVLATGFFRESAGWDVWAERAEDYLIAIRGNPEGDLDDPRWNALLEERRNILEHIWGAVRDAHEVLARRIDDAADSLRQQAKDERKSETVTAPGRGTSTTSR